MSESLFTRAAVADAPVAEPAFVAPQPERVERGQPAGIAMRQTAPSRRMPLPIPAVDGSSSAIVAFAADEPRAAPREAGWLSRWFAR